MAKPKDRKKWAYMFSEDVKFLQKAVIVKPKDNNLFLTIKRSSEDFSRPGEWDLPGGNVLFGQLHEESLRREIKEETSLLVGKLYPIYVETNYLKKTKIYYIFIGYICRANSDKVVIGDEHTSYKWVNRQSFRKLAKAQYLLDFVNECFMHDFAFEQF